MDATGLTRREFVRHSALGGLLLASVSGLSVLTGCNRQDPHDAPAYRLLRASDLPVVRALIPVVLSGALPEQPEPRAAYTERVIHSLDQLLHFSSPEIHTEAHRLLDLLSFPPTRIMVAGVARSWSSAEPADVAAFLYRWSTSPLALLQNSCNALTRSIQIAWHATPEGQAATGYPGPPQTADVLLRSPS